MILLRESQFLRDWTKTFFLGVRYNRKTESDTIKQGPSMNRQFCLTHTVRSDRVAGGGNATQRGTTFSCRAFAPPHHNFSGGAVLPDRSHAPPEQCIRGGNVGQRRMASVGRK